MTVIATIGEITIEVNNNDFDSFELSAELGYATIKKLATKPALQIVGDSLLTISIDFTFADFLTNPQEQSNQLREAALAKEPLPLVFGELYKGRWVIKSITEKPNNVDAVTGPRLLEFSMNLTEYVGIDLKLPQQELLVNPFEFIA